MKISEKPQNAKKRTNQYVRAFPCMLGGIFASIVHFFAKNFQLCKKTSAKKTGDVAENAAVKFLRAEKCLKILKRNYRCGRLEVDIVAFDERKNCIVFVEVKARAQGRASDAYRAAASLDKRKNIALAAKKYMASLKGRACGISHRYDIVYVLHSPDGNITDLKHFENVGFRSGGRGRML